MLFGDTHPYGYAGSGEEPLSQADAEALRTSLLQPNRSTLLVVGDTTLAQVRAEAQKNFAAFPSTPKTAETRAVTTAPDFLHTPWAFIENNTVLQYASIVGAGAPRDARRRAT